MQVKSHRQGFMGETAFVLLLLAIYLILHAVTIFSGYPEKAWSMHRHSSVHKHVLCVIHSERLGKRAVWGTIGIGMKL